jgi:hypothetical protein
MDWKFFLESQPPNQVTEIINLTDGVLPYIIKTPVLNLFCEAETCNGERFFDNRTSTPQLKAEDQEKWIQLYLNYFCRNCGSSHKVYALTISAAKNGPHGRSIKLGEWPPFGPRVPTKMIKLLGEDQEIFMKGRRAESQGMGVAAFAYYRRVVENQKGRLIDEIIRVCNRIKAPPALVEKLNAAKTETQFSRAVDIIKDGIPEILRLDGHNPLLLLHSALSEGLHAQSDQECLDLAVSIRVVLTEFSERLVQAMRSHSELDNAVSKLLQAQSKSGPKEHKDKVATSGTTE